MRPSPLLFAEPAMRWLTGRPGAGGRDARRRERAPGEPFVPAFLFAVALHRRQLAGRRADDRSGREEPLVGRRAASPATRQPDEHQQDQHQRRRAPPA